MFSDDTVSSSTDKTETPLETCKVCLSAKGAMHFGAISCRACAAFFRRTSMSTKMYLRCKSGTNDCHTKFGEKFLCKKCRLRKCYDCGMDNSKFQFDRDPISNSNKYSVAKTKKLINATGSIPKTMETFLGRPHVIITCEPELAGIEKTLINVKYLTKKVIDVLIKGPGLSVVHNCSLENLKIGLRKARNCNSPEYITKLGQNEIMGLWEKDILGVTRWLTYLEEFQKLNLNLRLKLVKSMWYVWSRLEKISRTAMERNQTGNESQYVLSNEMSVDTNNLEIDISWMTNYKAEQIAYFLDDIEKVISKPIIDTITDLNPTDTELCYMLFQLALYYAGKRNDREINNAIDNIQMVIANDLHRYYKNTLNLPNYSRRIYQMMKINNLIQEDMRKMHDRRELANVFDIFTIKFSDPEMFF